MTHHKPMPESSGRLSAESSVLQICRGECSGHSTSHQVWTWESHCGGYEDYKFKCTVCGHVFWIDGPDS